MRARMRVHPSRVAGTVHARPDVRLNWLPEALHCIVAWGYWQRARLGTCMRTRMRHTDVLRLHVVVPVLVRSRAEIGPGGRAEDAWPSQQRTHQADTGAAAVGSQDESCASRGRGEACGVESIP